MTLNAKSYIKNESTKIRRLKIMKKIFIVLQLLVLLNCFAEKNTIERAPIYITPIYNSSPFEINVGEYSDKLMKMNTDNALKLEEEIIENIDSISIETLYVFSIILYDLKMKDKAVHWYYTAQFRYRFFYSSFNKKDVSPEIYEIIHTLNAIDQLTGTYINGYAFGEVDKLIQTLMTVKKEMNREISLKLIYPDILFYNEEELNRKFADIADGLDDFID